MKKLPIIVGFGGINCAGRTSMHHGHKRLVFDALSENTMANTWQDLATLMGLSAEPNQQEKILAGTLIRQLNDQSHFDPNAIATAKKATLQLHEPICFTVKKSQLPQSIPEHWQVNTIDNRTVTITVHDTIETLLPDHYKSKVSSAGQLPLGFDPAQHYNATHHPRGLQMALYGASDAIHSIGLEWTDILQFVSPDAISVYAGSSLSQLDQLTLKGLYQAGYNGKRITSKMMPFAFPEMAADFINSYMINSIGNTGSNAGACATFLYNLRQGIHDIQSGQCRVAIVGNAEAPIQPEIMSGFQVMGALAEDEQLKQLDQSESVNHQRACRPFSTNAGFTIAESAQFMVLMDDELAMALGATAFGSVADVFINADGNKKSISGPGIGNYISMAKTAALAQGILGDQLRKTFVMAHGTGTPQNRVTESHILNEVAKTFGIEQWTTSAVKSYLGHSLGAAAADQIAAALGVWHTGIIPGIQSIDHIADDVHHSHLNILMQHYHIGHQGMAGAIINSKGFGGNNASALILSPNKTHELMTLRHGNTKFHQYLNKNEHILEAQQQYDAKTCRDGVKIIYKFAESVMGEEDVSMNNKDITLSEFQSHIKLPKGNPYL